MVKLLIVGRRRGGMTVSQLHQYMTDIHGAMVVRFIGESPEQCPKRYVQNHVFDGTTRSPNGTTHSPNGSVDPFTSSRDFVTQVWFDNPMQAKASIEAPLYLEHLQPDEENFVDHSSVVKLPVTELPIFGDATGPAAYKVFVFHQRAATASSEALAAASLAQWKSQLSSPNHGVGRVVRNIVMSRPDAPQNVDFIDEAWVDNEKNARGLASQWQDLATNATLRGIIAPRSCFVLLAREKVMFAGSGS